MSNVTIGFVPRDRFCRAAESLELLFECTHHPFELVVVDCGTPSPFREQIDRVLRGRDGVTVLRADASVSSNGARNLVLDSTTTEYVCLIENDVFVEEGWLSHLVKACEEHPADAAAPLLLEPRGRRDKVHFDDRLGHIRRTDSGRLEILPRRTPLETDREAQRRPTDFVEMHCVLFRRSVFERIGPFDATQHGSRAEVDLSLALWAGDVPTVLEPKSRVTFCAPPAVHPEERDYYLRYWDLAGARADHRMLEERWNLVECPSALGFVAGRRRLADEPDPSEQLRRHAEDLESLDRAAGELDEWVPDDAALILVDDAQWIADEIAGTRPVVPFLERDGKYYGSPADDETAIREFERLRRAGARYLVFGWPAFWWLEHYAEFHRHLRDRFACPFQNERLVLFDLGAGSERGDAAQPGATA